MKKTLFTLVLSLAVALCLPVAAFADYSEGYLYYTVADESITITGCFGESEELTVPASIAGVPVNTIGTGAFVGNSALKKVNLPDTVQTVEEGAIGSGITVVFNYNTEVPQEYTPQTPEGETQSGSILVNSDGSMIETSETIDIDELDANSASGANGSATVSSGSKSKKSTTSSTSASASNTNGTAIAVGVVVVVLVAAGIVVAVVMSRKRKAQAADGTDASGASDVSADANQRANHGPKR